MTIKFKDLQIKQTFDFVHPDPMYITFSDRCRKISARKYQSLDTGFVFRVGSIYCEVYHVGEHDNIPVSYFSESWPPKKERERIAAQID